MKKVIGAEISPRSRPVQTPLSAPDPEPEVETEHPARRSEHVLDLRPHPPAADEQTAEQSDEDLVVRDRVAEDVARLGMHHDPAREREERAEAEVEAQGSPTEQEYAGHEAGQGKKEDSVRTREGGLTGASKGGLPAARDAKPRRKFDWKRLLGQSSKIALVLIGAIFFLLLTIPVPERLIGIYFVASLVYAIDSQRTFIVALIFLIMVAVTSAIGQSTPAESYAVYAFYFLVIGLVSAIREQIRSRPKTVGGNSQISQ